jgi:predicted amidohydrolase
MSRTITVALWAVNMAAAPADAGGFVAAVDARLAETAGAGAELLVLPEYVAEQWLVWAPADLPENQEIAWMAEAGATILPRLRELPARRGVALIAGTMPVRAGSGAWRNRAHLLLPDGTLYCQDKLSLTPFERDPAGWLLEPGDTLEVIEWAGLRLAIVICLDIEQPALAARMQGLDLDLVLVPSMTSAASGHARVFGCARARAVELFTTVCAVGCIGSIPRGERPNVSGAAVWLPCEMALGSTGIAAELPASGATAGPGPLLIARDLPVGLVRRLRHEGAEVWPGAWSAAHLRVRR